MHKYKQTFSFCQMKILKDVPYKRYLFFIKESTNRPQQKMINTELKITEPCHLIKTKPVRGQIR